MRRMRMLYNKGRKAKNSSGTRNAGILGFSSVLRKRFSKFF
jgi:hypothetical protein